ncbi:prepilin-type N-terminal cleavage/methylation domain-containing protein [Cerasicoccus maritimus]|uniref:prepilin-type N-terminal cleavage/methylation domain-containing protein n=1 Tax=Cerasicoccus maritimus TaxID=490089 RepID=UPI0028525705|nr:prepilin-type N-terminal cleavage/methylation domain-containing protein [Cerasicoccus maritimus]
MLYHHPDYQHPSVKRRQGFTLVELLIVIAIIAILSSIVFGLTRGIAVKQARSKAQAEMQAIATALESYKLKYGDYPWLGEDDTENLVKHLTGEYKMTPTTDGNGDTTVNPNDTVPTANRRPFIDEEDFTIDSNGRFQDPWGNNYIYYYKRNNTSTWNFPAFILVCEGGDSDSDSTDLSTGNLPPDYFDDDKNVDNFIYGQEF